MPYDADTDEYYDRDTERPDPYATDPAQCPTCQHLYATPDPACLCDDCNCWDQHRDEARP